MIFRASAAPRCCGSCPVRIAGTACVVELVDCCRPRIPGRVTARAVRNLDTELCVERPVRAASASSPGTRRRRRARPACGLRPATSAPGASSTASGTVATNKSSARSRQHEREREERAERRHLQIGEGHEPGRDQRQRAGTRHAPDRAAATSCRAGEERRSPRWRRCAAFRAAFATAAATSGLERPTTTSGGTNDEQQREDDNVRARRSAHDQELRVPLQHREHRLAYAVSPQRGQMREAPPVGRQVHQSGDAW